MKLFSCPHHLCLLCIGIFTQKMYSNKEFFSTGKSTNDIDQQKLKLTIPAGLLMLLMSKFKAILKVTLIIGFFTTHSKPETSMLTKIMYKGL